MTKQNDTQYALLGLLTTGCQTGYSMKQMIDQSLNHFWKISYGQIYPTLKLLVDNGLASVHDTQQEGKPDKKEYYITTKGTEALKKWLGQPVENPPFEKNELLLKLFFSRHKDIDATFVYIENYQEILTARLNTFQGINEMINSHLIQEEDAPFWLFTLDYGMRTTQAAIDWCQETKNQLTKQKENGK